jgi:hypothetical protein
VTVREIHIRRLQHDIKRWNQLISRDAAWSEESLNSYLKGIQKEVKLLASGVPSLSSVVFYGIWNSVSRSFVHGIHEESPYRAWGRLYKMYGSKEMYKWRYSVRVYDKQTET